MWVDDEIVLFIVDYKTTARNPKFKAELERLRAFIATQYADGIESEQDELWIITERVERHILRAGTPSV